MEHYVREHVREDLIARRVHYWVILHDSAFLWLCNCNCMMLSDSDNYTQLTRDNLVTELTQLCSPASLRHILPSLTLHPGMFVIISPIQLLHSHKSSHAPTPPQRRNMCVAGKWQNNVNINCFSLNLLVETHAACCVSISDQWGQVWRVARRVIVLSLSPRLVLDTGGTIW